MLQIQLKCFYFIEQIGRKARSFLSCLHFDVVEFFKRKIAIVSIPSFDIFIAKIIMNIDSSSSSGSNWSRLKKIFLTSLFVSLDEGMMSSKNCADSEVRTLISFLSRFRFDHYGNFVSSRQEQWWWQGALGCQSNVLLLFANFLVIFERCQEMCYWTGDLIKK